MGPLEQAGVPDQEPVESHGTSRGSRSKGDRPLELVALNQESMGLLRIPWPLERDGAPYQEPIGPRAREVPKSIVNESPLEDPGAP